MFLFDRDRVRTCIRKLRRFVLIQLSYTAKLSNSEDKIIFLEATGLEPTTFRMQIWHSTNWVTPPKKLTIPFYFKELKKLLSLLDLLLNCFLYLIVTLLLNNYVFIIGFRFYLFSNIFIFFIKTLKNNKKSSWFLKSLSKTKSIGSRSSNPLLIDLRLERKQEQRRYLI